MKFLFVCLFVTLVANGAVRMTSATATSGASPRLINLGTVEGKSFFADDISRSWSDSRAYCSSLGMRFATIRSPAQWNLLDNASNNATNFQGYYWTAGRDASTPSQFHWDNTNDEIGDGVNWNLYPSSAYLKTCLFYYSHSGLDYLQQAPCTDIAGSLCETSHKHGCDFL